MGPAAPRGASLAGVDDRPIGHAQLMEVGQMASADGAVAHEQPSHGVRREGGGPATVWESSSPTGRAQLAGLRSPVVADPL